MNKRKGISTKISPNDQSLIKYVYYNYDLAEIIALKFTFSLGITYLKGAKAGEISLQTSQDSNSLDTLESNNLTKNDKKTQPINFFDTGSVNSISSSLEKVSSQNGEYFVVKTNIQKKPILQLFEMRLCQHLPQETTIARLLGEQKKSEGNNKTKKSRKMQKVEPIYCKNCGQRLFYFYLPEEKKVTLKEVLKLIDIDDDEEQVKNIEWNVMLGETVTKTTCIAKLEDKEFFLEENGKISFLDSWLDVEAQQKTREVLRYKPIYCQHEKIQQNTCQYCFEEVDPFELNLKKFLFQMEEEDEFKREMITTGSTLTEQENKFVDSLIQKERGILILDLDNTVLHSIQLGQIHKNRLEEIEEFYELKLGSTIQYKRQIGPHVVTSCFIVKMRPYFKDFIETAIRFYEIYVYTKGTRMYAQEICNAIRNQYASKEEFTINKNTKIEYYDFLKDKNAFTPSRIITRDEDPDLERKSLNNILPTRQQNLMVMDDLSSVWNYSSAVLFTVPYYFFFKRKHIEAQKMKKNNRIPKLNGKALDEYKEGQKLSPVQDLHVQKVEPVRQLPCDHFDREVLELENNLVEPVIQHPVDHFHKEVEEIEKNCDEILQLGNKQQIKAEEALVAEIQIQNNQLGVVDIVKGLAPEDKEYDYDILPRSDFYLIYASWNLVQIHGKFFSENKSLKEGDKKISFGLMHKKLKTEILEGTTIKFCMKNETKIDIYGRAIKLGCKVIQNDSETTPQYIIRLNNLKSNANRMYFKREQENERKSIYKNQAQIQTETIKQLKFYSQTLKIPIISESWIDFCYSFTYKFPLEPFIIDQENILNEIHEEDYEWIIEEHAKKLLQKIREENKASQNGKGQQSCQK